MSNIYQQNGHIDRKAYLQSLSEEYGIEEEVVFAVADMLGENEDFDGLVTTLQDEAERLGL